MVPNPMQKPIQTSAPALDKQPKITSKELAEILYNTYVMSFGQRLCTFNELTGHCQDCWFKVAEEALRY
jgi:hypothetical protein